MQGDIRGMKIAVIGGGAGCVAFLHHFVDLIGCLEAKFIKIKVYERRERVGPGLAYQEDCDSVLLNRGAPAQKYLLKFTTIIRKNIQIKRRK